MKYSLQCKYSMIDQTFVIVIKSMEQGSDYYYEWGVESVEQPLWLLTNNNIVFRTEYKDDLVHFYVQSSDKKIKQKQLNTMIPILTFETDVQELQIIYDYDHNPTKQDKIIGMIINKVMQSYGGGFLDQQQEYLQLQQNLKNMFLENKLFPILQQKKKQTKISYKKQKNKVEVKEQKKEDKEQKTQKTNDKKIKVKEQKTQKAKDKKIKVKEQKKEVKEQNKEDVKKTVKKTTKKTSRIQTDLVNPKSVKKNNNKKTKK